MAVNTSPGPFFYTLYMYCSSKSGIQENSKSLRVLVEQWKETWLAERSNEDHQAGGKGSFWIECALPNKAREPGGYFDLTDYSRVSTA